MNIPILPRSSKLYSTNRLVWAAAQRGHLRRSARRLKARRDTPQLPQFVMLPDSYS